MLLMAAVDNSQRLSMRFLYLKISSMTSIQLHNRLHSKLLPTKKLCEGLKRLAGCRAFSRLQRRLRGIRTHLRLSARCVRTCRQKLSSCSSGETPSLDSSMVNLLTSLKMKPVKLKNSTRKRSTWLRSRRKRMIWKRKSMLAIALRLRWLRVFPFWAKSLVLLLLPGAPASSHPWVCLSKSVCATRRSKSCWFKNERSVVLEVPSMTKLRLL